jgi:para-aminobenzoate synthetase component 1
MKPMDTRFEDWSQWLSSYNAIPAWTSWQADRLPSCWKSFWVEGQPSVLLESGRAPDGISSTAAHTLLGLEIQEMLIGWDDWAESLQQNAQGEWQPRKLFRGKSNEIWEQWRNQWQAPNVLPVQGFSGGVLGLLSYDLNRHFERIPTLAKDDLDLPYYLFYLPRTVLHYNHQERLVTAIRWYYPSSATASRNPQQIWQEQTQSLKMLRLAWEHACSTKHSDIGEYNGEPLPERVSGPITLPADAYSAAVERIQEYITAGHSYQVNLALRQSEPNTISGWKIYEAVRRINPSPYMGLWRHPDFEIVSGSPELLVRKHGDKVSARPIAGTRPRGTSNSEDQSLSSELQTHPKENAEHLMLVDLIRNDLGRICRPGTVHVPEFMVQERYSHVIHLVSQVEGIWDEKHSLGDLIPAVFPGGTITGAPKVRTMEIIEEMEPVRRYYYTGSMGWINFQQDAEWNILIRTLILKDQQAHLYTGAGIVADSIPEQEFLECLQKGKALWKSLALARSWENRLH